MVRPVYYPSREPTGKQAEIGPGPVHQGVVRTYETVRGQLSAFVPGRKAVRRTVEHAAYCVMCICAIMHGWEPMKILLAYLIEFSSHARSGTIGDGVPPNSTRPFAGRFKLRGNIDQNVLLYVAEETKSCLKPRVKIDRLFKVLGDQGVSTGQAFETPNGSQSKMSDFEEEVFAKLQGIQVERPDLIPAELNVTEEV
jgi:hypothetical protein